MLKKLKEIIEGIETDAVKAEAGNKAAGTRVRLAMQAVKEEAQNIRTKITEIKGGK